ncbi:unnamed protein product [Boreogadus saida]
MMVLKMLQRKDADIQKAVCLIQNAVQGLTTYREDFTEVKRSAQAVAQKWGVRCEFTQVRARRVRRHYNDLCEDERLSDPESNFRVNVFNASLDIIINQLLQSTAPSAAAQPTAEEVTEAFDPASDTFLE